MRYKRIFAVLLACASWAAGQQAPAKSGSSGATSASDGKAQVIFSRSVEDAGAAAAAGPVRPAAGTPGKQATAAPVADSERQPVAFLSYDLDVHLQPVRQGIAVRARMVLRNDGDQPMRRLPLQISSTLEWSEIRVEDKTAAFSDQLVNSDADHTGTLHEAVIALAQPLAPGQSISVDATYQGAIELSTHRLEDIGTPRNVAARSDWDRVSEDFVGLRGFGNVVWYPVVSRPVALGDGDKFFTEIADQKLRQKDAMISMQVTEEFSGSTPNLAVLDGKLIPVTPASLPSTGSLTGIATCRIEKTRLGFATPSLFVLNRAETRSGALDLFTQPVNAANAQAYETAASMVEPLLNQWIGPRLNRELAIIDLPEANDAPFESGAVLFTSVQSADPDKLAGGLIHSLTHARFQSPYPWLEEGIASFMGTLWIERNLGREMAITQMDNSRGALSLVEPEISSAELSDAGAAPHAAPADAGESLLAAKDAIYYRTKATYVFWMLRDLAGDDALALAFREYEAAKDIDGTEFEQVLERSSKKDLKWFFSDWVYHDRGLPDLSIAGVFPNSANAPGSFIVAVDVANSGEVEAEVPVSVRSSTATVTERLRVPANSKISHRFLLAGAPVEVAVNDGTVPEVEASVHRRDLSVEP
ncbi:MAG TPA: hypothetical protein VGR96_11635 [Acidobacteriaceae bacterium]|nr:hypothetical protein [Acidobacteriaceae bacterium]